jgi:beta-aspartyl-dipeptidase (metallo-type)
MFTGGYRVPIHTITGSIQRDLILIQPVIGIGEVALSDHRGTYPSFDILVQNVSDCRVGGILSNKGGIVQVHVGNGKQKLQPLWDIVNETDIPISQFHPTHVSSRGEELVQDVQQWLEQGGSADVTADEPGSFKTCELLNRWKGLDILKRVTISSDAYGSLPVFDKGKLIKYAVASPEACLHTIQRLVKEFNWSLPEVLPLVTSNVAKIYKLGEKGEIKVDYDADIVVLDVQVQVVHVLAKGKWLKQGPFVKKGMFE